MGTPIEALHNVGDRTLKVFKKAGLETVSDLYSKTCAQPLQRALDELKDEAPELGDAYWRAMGTRVHSIIARVRSDEARPYEPDHFICPITLQLMEDPVISKYGHSYERSAIEKLVNTTGRDMYHQELSRVELFQNRNLHDAIQYYKAHELRFSVPIKLVFS